MASLKGQTRTHPQSHRFLPARHQKPWKGLEAKKASSTPPPPFTPLRWVEHNQAQPPNHETQVERDLQQFPVLLSGPLLLIVPETTDGNCERKHVNTAGVMAESGVEWRSSQLSQGGYYNMKRSEAFRKQPLCVRNDSCQDPTHRSINTQTETQSDRTDEKHWYQEVVETESLSARSDLMSNAPNMKKKNVQI